MSKRSVGAPKVRGARAVGDIPKVTKGRGISVLLVTSLLLTLATVPLAHGAVNDQGKGIAPFQHTTWVESPTPSASEAASTPPASEEAPLPAVASEAVSEQSTDGPPDSAESASADAQTPKPIVDPSPMVSATSMGSPAPPVTPSPDAKSPEPPQVETEATSQGILPMSVPNPGTNQAVITVRVGDLRTGLTSIGGLRGARLGLFANPSDTNPVAGAWTTCTSDADGDCSFTVPNVATTGSGTSQRCRTGATGVNCDRRFWVKQISAPDTHFTNTALGTTGGESPYRFQTGTTLRAGNTYRSTSNFMYSASNTNNLASAGVWQNSRRNPVFPQQCGIDVAMVLDLSNSVTAADLVQMKRAASGFVDALTGTPSQMGIFTFATNAPASAGQTLEPVAVSTDTGANTVKNKINGYRLPASQAGGTNWDRGFYQVVQSASDFDVVMIITDGNPTYSGNAAGPGNATRFTELENGIFSANAIKAAGSKVIAFGVGAGISSPASSLNLRSISGPIEDRDYYRTDDYAGAGAQLRELALGNCTGSVSVVKQVIPAGGTVADASPAGGWTFRGMGSNGVTVDSPSIQVTNPETGAANFPLSFAPGASTGSVTLTETAQSGFTLEQVGGRNATCTRLDTGASVASTNTVNGFTVAANIGYPVSCIVYNRALQLPRLTLVKRVEAGTTGATDTPSDWTLTAAGPTRISGPGNSPAVTSRSVAVGTYTLTEAGGPAGYVAGAWDCVGGRLSGGRLTLTYGDSATCTITNTASQAKLTLVKTVTNDSGGSSSPDAWRLTATGPTTGLSGGTGTPAVTGRLVDVGSYVLSEAGPEGYNAGAWNCSALLDGASVPVQVRENSIVRVEVGQDVTCAINNDDQTRIAIQKWGSSAQGVIGPIDGASFEVRVDDVAAGGEGGPGALVGSVTPVAGQRGTFRAAAFDPGSYWLVETEAPSGNSLLATPIGFTIGTDGSLTILGDNPQAEVIDGDPRSLTIRITDVAGIPLPLSGGASPNLVLLAMVVLAIGGVGVVLIRRQRPRYPTDMG